MEQSEKDIAGQTTLQEQDEAALQEQPSEPEKSYLQRRVFDEMGLTLKQNRITLKFDTGVDGRDGKGTFDIFSEDEDGNIKILVYTLHGWLVQYFDPNMGKTYDQSNVKRLIPYYVTRIAPQNIKEGDSKKYNFPKGQGTYPFFPPNLLKKFKNHEDIDTLILTEGYFKAMCGSLYGFDVVGLGYQVAHQLLPREDSRPAL